MVTAFYMKQLWMLVFMPLYVYGYCFLHEMTMDASVLLLLVICFICS